MSNSNKRLYRQIADKILVLIETGEYSVGSRLPSERQLAERFSVSRPTIREAVIALEAKGRVSVKTGSGVYVVEPSVEFTGLAKSVSPFELIESRVFIEGEAAALAAVLITESQLAELEKALEAMALENVEGHPASVVADRKFHSIISEATNNGVLSMLISQLWDVQEELDNIRLAHQAVCMKDDARRLAEHRAIFEAMVAKDSNKARIAMRNHFSRMLTALHETIEQEAVSEVQRKVSQMRERFPVGRMDL
jgi:DNA-binding FadR family transcriptional regulator